MDRDVKIEVELLTKKVFESINVLTYGKEIDTRLKDKIQESIKHLLYNILLDIYRAELEAKFDD